MFWNKNKNASTSTNAAPSRSPLALSLEPRMLFDGAVAATVADAAQPDATQAATGQPNDSQATDSHDATAATPPAATTDQRQEIVFVDGKLQDAQALIAGLPSGTEVVVLDSSKDGLQQIADYLKDRTDVDAIHLLSHGAEGTVELGNIWLNNQNIGQHAEQLNAIGAALAADGDILIYGCDTGEGAQGATLLSELARLTQADVAASDDATGAANKGGDWVLESRTGQVESQSLQVTAYNALLAAPADENYDDDASGTVFNSNTFDLDGIRYVLTGTGTYETSIEDGGTSPGVNNGLLFDFSNSNPDGIGGLTSVTISAADGSAFNLAGISFLIYDLGIFGSSSNVTLTTSSGETLGPFAPNGSIGNLQHLDLSGNTDFQNITSFTFSGTNLILEIDNLNFEAAIPPSAAPSLSATAVNPTFTENGSAVDLFSAVTAATNDSGQTFSGAALTVTNVSNGTAEILSIGGTDIALSNGNSGTITGIGNYSVSVAAGTATITLTGMTRDNTQMGTLIDGITYRNTSNDPGSASRVVTITQITDSGGSNSTATPNIASTVTVTAVNDLPTVANAIPNQNATEDSALNFQFDANTFSDLDADALTYTAQLAGGGALPAWLSFDAATRTFSGTPGNANVGTLSIEVIASDGNGGSVSDTFDMVVSAVNDAPVITAPPSIAITEDMPGALTGISFSDADAGSADVSVTLSVPSGSLSATSAGGVTVGGTSSAMTLTGSISDINAFIAAAGVVFTTASNATSDVTLTVGINDGGNTDSTTLTLDVTAVNDAPVNSIPAAQSVDQDASLVFSNGNGNQISIGDVDAGANSVEVTLSVTNGVLTLAGTAGLSFTTGDGTADSSLVFSGSITDINAALATLTYSPTSGYNGAAVLSITTSDLDSSGSGGTQTDTDNVNITVNSLNPRITDVSASTPDGSYKVGDTITITTTFNQAVTVDTTGGTPTLLLETGLTDRIATYVSGSGSNTLTFSYTVQPGDLSADLDYQSTAALSLNGATIQNITADNAVLTLPTPGTAGSLAANETIVIDGVAATVSSVSVPANGVYVAGDNLDFTVNLSENVTVDTSGGTPRIAITLDTGGTAYASYLSGSGTSALVFRLTVASGQMDSNGISLGSSIDANGGNLRDTAGNNSTTTLNAVGSTTGVLVDAVAPQINAISLDAASPTNASSVTFTVTFSEDVSGVDIGDFSLATSGSVNATLQSLTQIDPRTYQVTVDTITGLGSLGLNATGAGIIDNASNPISNAFTGQTYTIDSLRPSASIVVADTALAAGETSTVTITFNEAVSGLTSADFTVSNGVLSGLSSGDGGITWTAIFTPTASVENTSNVITLDNTGYTDLAGNAGTGSTDSNNYTVDTAQALVIENGDPEFRANPPSQPPALPPAPLQPTTPVPSPSTTQSPLIPPPLFEIPTIGSGIPTLGNIFINQNALAPSYIAQVFASSSNDIGGDGSGSGFLGFGGGDGGVFGSSSLSNIFGQDSQQETEQLEVFDGKKWGSTEGSRPGTFGAPTLSQQLHELHEVEQRQVRELAQALGQLESVQTQA